MKDLSTKEVKLSYLCDNSRHLICLPYSIKNLHIMAEDLGINKCFYHFKGRNVHPHYDIPKKRIKEIMSKCEIIPKRDLFKIINENIKNT